MGKLIEFRQSTYGPKRVCFRCQHYESIDLYLTENAPEFTCLMKRRRFTAGDVGMAVDCQLWQEHEFLPKDLG